MPSERNLTYKNVMESLVAEEVDRQFQQLQPKLARYLNKEEVTAFALNRLPALYATSEKGWRQQSIKGRRDCSTQITTAVRQAIVAVQRDPLRVEAPLPPREDAEGLAALQELKVILRREDLNWHNLPDLLEQALMKTARGEITWQRRTPPATPSRPGAPRPPGAVRHPPGVFQQRVSQQSMSQPPAPPPAPPRAPATPATRPTYDWSNDLYKQ